MKKLFFGLGLVLPFLLSAQQVPRSLTAANGQQIGFYEFKPADYNSNSSANFPLIIFLHGIGERGDGSSTLSNVLNVGLPHYINMGATMSFNVNGQQQSFMVLSPQLSYNYGSWENFYVDEMIKYAKNNLRVDANRIYLTGLSLGGGGVWKYASASAANAQQFAGIAPVCGTCEYSNLCNIAQNRVAVWAFHAMDDGTVSVGCTQNAISALNSCGAQIAPKATYYPTGNHWIWDMAYDMTHNIQSPLNVFEWMLTQSRSGSVAPPPPSSNIPPIAVTSPDQTVTLPTNSTNLSGSGSYDQDGTITSYNWSQVSGSAATIGNASSPNTTVSNLPMGTCVFRLKVTDNAGASSTKDVQVTENGSTSVAPVASAGPNQTISLPTNSVLLIGSASYVPGGGTISSFAWSQVSGPNTATMTNLSPSNVQAGNLIAGTYTFKLTVTAGQASASSQMNVIVNGTAVAAPPVANAGSNQTLTLPTNSASLNGSGSTGSNLSYTWSEASGPSQFSISNPNIANPTASNLVAGTYSFKLTVQDNTGASSSANVQVVVNNSSSSGYPVVAVAGSNQTLTSPTSSTYLVGSASYSQGGGSITSYAWTQISGPNTATMRSMSASNVEASNLVSGVYVFRLTVTNSSGNTSTSDLQVTLNGTVSTPGNQAPIANAGNDLTISSTTVSLNAWASRDPDGSISAYSWKQVSGPNQSTISGNTYSTPTLSNLVSGSYVFELTVTDNQGATGKDQIQINVNVSANNQIPVAKPGNDVSIWGNTTSFNAWASYDPDGYIAGYSWKQISGPNQSVISGNTYSTPSISNLVTGVYVFELAVSDNQGAVGYAQIKVSVNGAVGAANPSPAPVDQTAATALSVYPNPVTTSLTVEFTNAQTGNVQINFIDAGGKTVKTIATTKTSSSFKQQVDVTSLSAGTYVVEIMFSDGTRLTQNIVKQ